MFCDREGFGSIERDEEMIIFYFDFISMLWIDEWYVIKKGRIELIDKKDK